MDRVEKGNSYFFKTIKTLIKILAAVMTKPPLEKYKVSLNWNSKISWNTSFKAMLLCPSDEPLLFGTQRVLAICKDYKNKCGVHF